MVGQEKISRAVELLREAAKPKKIILFGSYVEGKQGEQSDVDLMVVEEGISDVVKEMVRLRRLLSPLRIPVDLIVVPADHYEYWSDTPGNIMYEAAYHGETLYEAA